MSFVHRYSLGIILFSLFMAFWLVQIAVQIDMGEGWREITKATMENWQSEFLQLFAFVFLSKWFFFEGSKESKKPGTPSDEED